MLVNEAVTDAYCTDQPVSATGEVVGLNNSIKSKQNGVGEPLPPPPYTWLITSDVELGAPGFGTGAEAGLAPNISDMAPATPKLGTKIAATKANVAASLNDKTLRIDGIKSSPSRLSSMVAG
ncbi:MAG: hypothetical protein ABIO92_06810 [Chloroflexia bacterium]